IRTNPPRRSTIHDTIPEPAPAWVLPKTQGQGKDGPVADSLAALRALVPPTVRGTVAPVRGEGAVELFYHSDFLYWLDADRTPPPTSCGGSSSRRGPRRW